MSERETAEERRDRLEVEAALREYFGTLDLGECPTCGVEVTLRRVGRCVYGSCGCRLYQGSLPKRRRAP